MKKIKIFLICLLIIIMIPIGINLFVLINVKDSIYNIDDVNKEYDYALVLGCSVHKDGTPSLMLRDRLDKAYDLYSLNIISKIVISGDHSEGYSEVDVMKKYLINKGVNKEDIIRDDKGYSTGDSIKNYYNNYKDKSLIIVTQNYHLYRASYIAKKYKLNYIGVYAKKTTYGGQLFREIREILARVKDFLIY